jgi:hypothetical protein
MVRHRGDKPTVALVERAMSGEREAIRHLVEGVTPTVQIHAARALLRDGLHASLQEKVETVTLAVLDRLFASGGKGLLSWETGGGSFEERLDRWADEQVASIVRDQGEPTSDLAGSRDTPSAP